MGIPKLVQDTVVIKDSIAKMKLDKELIKFTKQVVLKHEPGYYRAVSYTHLDVYKRQTRTLPFSPAFSKNTRA